MMTPPLDCAMSIARADLPQAVAPHIIAILETMSKSVLTLIAPADKKILNRHFAARFAARMGEAGAVVIATEWLAEEEACDFIFSRIEPEAAEALAKEELGD